MQMGADGKPWLHSYAMPTWKPDENCAREMAAYQSGMTVPPFQECSSMAKRLPHMQGLILMNHMKPVYFLHDGAQIHQSFGKLSKDNKIEEWYITATRSIKKCKRSGQTLRCS